MIKKYLFILLCLCIFGCGPRSSIGKITIPIAGEEITLVWVDGGSFIMGSSELIANSDEKPTHKIHIDGFWMTETPITNNQFAAFVNSTNYVTTAEKAPSLEEMMLQLPKGSPPIPDEFLVPGSLVFIAGRAAATSYSSIDWLKWSPNTNWKSPRLENPTLDGFGDHPVVHVSWYDATEFSLWSGMQLPTEAQWEYAAKLGNVTNTREMNIWRGIFPINNEPVDGHLKTNPVKYYKTNSIGLYDMAGNVWEWVRDWYRPNTYSMEGRSKNPVGPKSSFDPMEPSVPKRVTRGGSFLCSDQYCAGYRTTARMKSSPDTSLENTGFRCVMSKTQMEKILKIN